MTAGPGADDRDAGGPVPLAAVPTGPVPVPALVRQALPGRDLEPVWVNALGGTTWRVPAVRGLPALHVKWASAGVALDLRAEADRLRWAAGRTPVPPVEALLEDAGGCVLITRTVAGRSAVDPRWLAEPEAAVAAVGRGLRDLHDALPVQECPFSASVADRLSAVRPDVPDEVRRRLADPPPVDRLVVTHGDACMPNTLLADDGTWSAHVDLGGLGVGDRWADLAVATWSTGWNVGPGFEDLLLDAYGIRGGTARHRDRIGYYRALWDAGP